MTEVIRLHTPPVTELDRYSVVSRFERIAILRGLIEKRAMVTLSFGDESRFVLTTLLAINPEYEELVFETPRASGNGAAAPDPLAADIVETTGDSELDSVKVRFLSGRAERTTWQGQAAFRLRLPERMWRLQRREGFRIDGPVAYPVVCRCLLPDAIAHTHLRVTDISIGGVSLAIEAPLRLPQAGEQIRECHIELCTGLKPNLKMKPN